VHDAARQLDISEDAVRMRIKRGTLASEKVEGRLYVYLTPEPTTDRTGELLEELRARVHSLEHQLTEEREANRENRRIIAALTSRIPAIEAPQEAPEAPERSTQGAPNTQTPSEGQEASGEARPWWRRMFGG
jgi:hypothetical protein